MIIDLERRTSTGDDYRTPTTAYGVDPAEHHDIPEPGLKPKKVFGASLSDRSKWPKADI